MADEEETPAPPESVITPEQLAAANAAAASAQMESARLRAMREFPAVSEDVLAAINGTPEEIRAFAEVVSNNIAAATANSTPAPGPEPTPTPGPGANPTTGDVNQARMEELTEKVLDKTATRGTPLNGRPKASEAVELFNLSMVEGFRELQGARK